MDDKPLEVEVIWVSEEINTQFTEDSHHGEVTQPVLLSAVEGS